jgi:ribosomal protein L28
MRLYFRVGLNYSAAFKATGLIIAVVLITSLTVYISWEGLKSLDDAGFVKELQNISCEGLKSLDDTGFVKELQKLNLNITDSGKQYENISRTRRSSIARCVVNKTVLIT